MELGMTTLLSACSLKGGTTVGYDVIPSCTDWLIGQQLLYKTAVGISTI